MKLGLASLRNFRAENSLIKMDQAAYKFRSVQVQKRPYMLLCYSELIHKNLYTIANNHLHSCTVLTSYGHYFSWYLRSTVTPPEVNLGFLRAFKLI